ncbi:MAG: tetratricopeptide repeat protein [Planctomycetia bacterium]
MINRIDTRHSARLLAIVGLAMLLAAWNAHAAETQEEITRLESRLFDPVLSEAEVDGLLKRLEKPDTREGATKTLIAKGQGRHEQIIWFAHKKHDVETYQACADVIEALDASYRTTELGKQLGTLYRQQAGELLPSRWARFRKDSSDPRAVAFLMYADPERVYKWLGKKERYDQIRYLLLRFREDPTDDFAFKHFPEHTAASATRSASDVFPIVSWNENKFGGYQRMVGNTGLKYVCITPEDFHTGIFDKGYFLFKIEQISYNARHVFLYRHIDSPSSIMGLGVGYYHLYFSDKAYRPDRYDPKCSGKIMATFGDRLVAPLPILNRSSRISSTYHVSRDDLPYVPKVYQFGQKKEIKPLPEQLPPKALPIGIAPSADLPPAKPLAPSAPTVVILSPRMAGQSTEAYRVAAGGLCDRIAQEITAAGLARVVNRTELSRILEEYRLAKVNNSKTTDGKIVSYDAVLRVAVIRDVQDYSYQGHKVQVSLIDLNTGNELGCRKFLCPMTDADLEPLKELCRTSLAKVGKVGKGKLKVRLLWQHNADAPTRLSGQGRQLTEIFRESIERSKNIVVVEHLETSTTEEESLLLSMGLSRLAGERRFSPQADATIELRLTEQDAEGKTFEETPVEIAFRIRKENGYRGDWVKTRATVAEFHPLLRKAWKKLAKALEAAEPDSVADVLDEMPLRRKQARAEMAAAKTLLKNYRRNGMSERQLWLKCLGHVQTAIKLDPTYAEAAIEEIRLSQLLGRYMKDPAVLPHVSNVNDYTLKKSLDFLERFPDNPEFRARAVSYAMSSLYTPETGPLFWVDKNLVFRGIGKDQYLVTPSMRRTFADSEKVLKHALTLGKRINFQNVVNMTVFTYRGKKLMGISPDERRAWLEEVLQRSDKEIQKIDMAKWGNSEDWEEWFALHLRSAQLILDDGNETLAKKIVERAMAQPIPTSVCKWDDVFLEGQLAMIRLDDLELFKRYEAWCKASKESEMDLISLKWPTVKLFEDKRYTAGNSIKTVPALKEPSLIYHSEMENRNGMSRPQSVAIAPLIEVGDRLYVMTKKGGRLQWHDFHAHACDDRPVGIAYLPLDKLGQPVGEQTKKNGHLRWENLHWIREPSGLLVLDCCYVDGKLILGTLQSGLLIFDPHTEKWTKISTTEGLSENHVQKIFPLDKKRLLVIQRGYKMNEAHKNYNEEIAVCSIVDLSSKKVTLLYKHAPFYRVCRAFWYEDGKVVGWNDKGRVADPLAGSENTRRWRARDAYGWPGVDYELLINKVASVGDRVYCITDVGFHECNTEGKILRSWWPGRSYKGVQGFNNLSVPASCPLSLEMIHLGGRMIQAESLLIFLGDESLTLYDTKNDTWYGPVRLYQRAGNRILCAYATPHTLWLSVEGYGNFGNTQGLERVAIKDFMARARELGRALTSKQYLEKRQVLIDALEPFDQAKVYFMIRKFKKSKALLEKILAKKPDHPEALLLMGHLHNSWCLKKPEAAIEYFQKLVDLKDNPQARFTGLYWQCEVLRRQKRWQETDRMIRQIRQEFPRLAAHLQRNLDSLQKRAKQNLRQSKKEPVRKKDAG